MLTNNHPARESVPDCSPRDTIPHQRYSAMTIRKKLVKPLTATVLALSLLPLASTAQNTVGHSGISPLPLDSISTFARVFETIKNNYVEEVTDEELLRNAIEGMVEGLDPHSALLDSQEMSDVETETTGRYGGLGIEVTKENGGIRVISPIDGTPAFDAGILPGDLIIQLDDHLTSRMNLIEAVNSMRGQPGTDITLIVLRQGVDVPLEFTLTRAVIRIKSVHSFILEPGFGYLRITQFQTTTPELTRIQIKKLITDSISLDGLVMDLRNNPGGELHSAVGVSDVFIDNGLIVSTRSRNNRHVSEFRSTPGDAIEGVPLVVLVNEGSASASEIVAGALQDHKRAIIMGENTFGKGSVQTIVRLNEDTALKLTTDRYYTPNNRSIQASGIVPDITVEWREVEEPDEQNESMTFRESNLEDSLENENAVSPDELDNQLPSTQVNPAVKRDYQLLQALNLLKGLRISGSFSS
ncbi:MAG: S41 family peptidase [Acidiferrobacterales bacterium]|nr:S41 family peptidase [Acidiferrobacterales bacterium]